MVSIGIGKPNKIQFQGELLMTQVAKEVEVQEADFQEVEHQEGRSQAEGQKVSAELTIQILEDGGMNLNVNEEYQELNSAQVEGIARSVYERLYEQRISAQALELFKSKLSF